MSDWRKEPVKVGDQFLTEKGGVVTVKPLIKSDLIEADGPAPCVTGFWNLKFGVMWTTGNTAEQYGPIIDKINKEKTMHNQEWKTGPCIIRAVGGKTEIHGRIDGIAHSRSLSVCDDGGSIHAFKFTDFPSRYTIEYPAPALPTKIGTVIEAGDGVRFMRLRDDSSWAPSTNTGYTWPNSDPEVTAYCASHGGWKVVLE